MRAAQRSGRRGGGMIARGCEVPAGAGREGTSGARAAAHAAGDEGRRLGGGAAGGRVASWITGRRSMAGAAPRHRPINSRLNYHSSAHKYTNHGVSSGLLWGQ